MPGCATCDLIRRERDRMERENRSLQGALAAKNEEIARLRAALDAARRDGKRQAGPFSKGKPTKDPRKPGRKPGTAYGPKANRPQPDHVDETLEASLPDHCPDCGGALQEDANTEEQFQADIPPVKPHVLCFRVHVGHCADCGQRVQGRHPRQTSDALGAAASQIGPRAASLGAYLNKSFGLAFGKVQRLFLDAFDLSITRGGIYHATARVARVAEPTYLALTLAVRGSRVVSPDETGWKVAGERAWLWGFATEHLTVYAIERGRGYDEAKRILGHHFAGVLARDGWAPYRKFLHALHQTCLAHLDRRCREMLEVAARGAARVPHEVRRILALALDLRDRRDQGRLSPHGLAVARGHLEARLDRLLRWRPTDDANRKLLKHLRHERDAMFTFLRIPGVPATNWWSEHAMRFAVRTRKLCAGNRSWQGAHVQAVLASLLRTAHQQGRDPLAILTALQYSTRPTLAMDLIAPPVHDAILRALRPRPP